MAKFYMEKVLPNVINLQLARTEGNFNQKRVSIYCIKRHLQTS